MAGAPSPPTPMEGHEGVTTFDAEENPENTSPSTRLPPGNHQQLRLKRSRVKPTTRLLPPCAVCGDRGAGQFYGVTVCHPCKTFFVRYCKSTNLYCRHANNCLLSVNTRASCKSCRLKRCIQVGMVRAEKPESYTPQKGQLLCTVCSDISNGVHFGVITCEGCKKFFRRSEREANIYVCRNHGKCVINPRKRNSCRFCRYQKCLEVGMSRNAIQIGRPRKHQTSGDHVTDYQPPQNLLPNPTTHLNGFGEGQTFPYPTDQYLSNNSGITAGNKHSYESVPQVAMETSQAVLPHSIPSFGILRHSETGASPGVNGTTSVLVAPPGGMSSRHHFNDLPRLLKKDDHASCESSFPLLLTNADGSHIYLATNDSIRAHCRSDVFLSNETYQEYSELEDYTSPKKEPATILNTYLPHDDPVHNPDIPEDLCNEASLPINTYTHQGVVQRSDPSDHALKQHHIYGSGEQEKQVAEIEKLTNIELQMCMQRLQQQQQQRQQNFAEYALDNGTIPETLEIPKTEGDEPGAIDLRKEKPQENNGTTENANSEVQLQCMYNISETLIPKKIRLSENVKEYWSRLADMAIQEQTVLPTLSNIIDDVVNAHSRFMDTFTNVDQSNKRLNDYRNCSAEHNELETERERLQLIRDTSNFVIFARSIPGFQNIHQTDQYGLIRHCGIEAMILTASVCLYDRSQNDFTYFYERPIAISHPSYYFRLALLEFAARFQLVGADRVELALMVAIIVISADRPKLEDSLVIEKVQLKLLAALHSYTTAKNGEGNNRIRQLFQYVPAVRQLGQWHYELSKDIWFQKGETSGSARPVAL